jgi:hypothetical protein
MFINLMVILLIKLWTNRCHTNVHKIVVKYIEFIGMLKHLYATITHTIIIQFTVNKG